MILSDQEIKTLIETHGLVQDFINLDTQLTSNGLDLTVASIHEFAGPGRIDFSNDERALPETREIPVEKKDAEDEYGWWRLRPGAYKIRTNETVKIPANMVALAFPRSSLLRAGVHIKNGVWDAGFQGKSEFLLVVENPDGVEIKQNARVNHLVFLWMSSETRDAYNGIYNEVVE